jgi:hypothetical protein
MPVVTERCRQCRFWWEGREDCCGWDWEIEGDEPSEPPGEQQDDQD